MRPIAAGQVIEGYYVLAWRDRFKDRSLALLGCDYTCVIPVVAAEQREAASRFTPATVYTPAGTCAAAARCSHWVARTLQTPTRTPLETRPIDQNVPPWACTAGRRRFAGQPLGPCAARFRGFARGLSRHAAASWRCVGWKYATSRGLPSGPRRECRALWSNQCLVQPSAPRSPANPEHCFRLLHGWRPLTIRPSSPPARSAVLQAGIR